MNIRLDRKAVSGGNCTALGQTCTVTYGLPTGFVQIPEEDPFMNHPDQWDSLGIHTTDANRSFRVSDMRITYMVKEEDSNHNWNINYLYSFVETNNIGHPASYGTAFWSAAMAVMNQSYVDLTAPFILSGTDYSLASNIVARRQQTATDAIVKSCFNHSTFCFIPTFSQLPAVLREASHDIGQSGTRKYSNLAGLSCASTQCYFQYNSSNISEYYNDFTRWCHQGSGSYRWCEGGPYPNPEGTLYEPSFRTTRKLARVRFVQTGSSRTGLDPTRPFPVVDRTLLQNGEIVWYDTSNNYQPKAGDMFWRFDRCWHGTGSERHAMTLFAAPYFDASGKFRVPVMEGASMTVFLDREEPSDPTKFNPLNEKLGWNCDSHQTFIDSESNRTYCKIYDSAGKELRSCPYDGGFRYEYYIGEMLD